MFVFWGHIRAPAECSVTSKGRGPARGPGRSCLPRTNGRPVGGGKRAVPVFSRWIASRTSNGEPWEGRKMPKYNLMRRKERGGRGWGWQSDAKIGGEGHCFLKEPCSQACHGFISASVSLSFSRSLSLFSRLPAAPGRPAFPMFRAFTGPALPACLSPVGVGDNEIQSGPSAGSLWPRSPGLLPGRSRRVRELCQASLRERLTRGCARVTGL